MPQRTVAAEIRLHTPPVSDRPTMARKRGEGCYQEQFVLGSRGAFEPTARLP